MDTAQREQTTTTQQLRDNIQLISRRGNKLMHKQQKNIFHPPWYKTASSYAALSPRERAELFGFPPTIFHVPNSAAANQVRNSSSARHVCSTYEQANGKGKKAKTAKITSWSIRADVVRKLDRGEPEPETVVSGSAASSEALDTSDPAPF